MKKNFEWLVQGERLMSEQGRRGAPALNGRRFRLNSKVMGLTTTDGQICTGPRKNWRLTAQRL